MLNGR